MITHYQITLLPEHETRIFPEWGYHLYSSLLSLTPHGFGERMHSNGITPLSSCITVQDKKVINGQSIPGFTGELTLKCRLDGFHLTMANLLLHFAPYAGVGIKTALGMGGVTCE